MKKHSVSPLAFLLVFGVLQAAAQERTPTQDGIVCGSAYGQSLTTHYYAPRGPGPHPVAIIIHGGGYIGGTSKNECEAYCAALKGVGVSSQIMVIPGGKHATGGWYKVPGVPDWERQMTVWLNTQLHHTGPLGEGIRAREPEAPSAASASAR